MGWLNKVKWEKKFDLHDSDNEFEFTKSAHNIADSYY